MEFGISMFGDNHYHSNGTVGSAGERLRELLTEVQLMDELGINFFGIGEHHRTDYAVSTPEIILAAAATRTKNIQLSSAVAVLSSADPVRLYQQYATIDQLSNGRTELTVGRGSFIESFPLYGYNLNDYEALFEEKLDLLVRINQQNPITWKGKYRAALNNQQILPRAVNDYLNIWVAVGGTPESVVRAARYALPVYFAIIGGNPVQFKPLFDYYHKAWAHYEHSAKQAQTGVHIHCFFGKNGTATANNYYPLYAAQMNRVGSTRGWPPYQRHQFDYGRGKNGALVIGDVNEAVEKILYLHEQLGFNRFAAHMDVGGPAHADLLQSIELFGNEVIPRVKKALGIATTN